MLYVITGKNFSAAAVTSADGVVRQSTANFSWACGQPIDEVLAWASDRGMCSSSSRVVPRGLSLCGEDPTAGLPAGPRCK